MTVVFNTINRPASQLPADARITIELVGENGRRVAGYVPTLDITVEGVLRVAVDEDFRWEADLVANSLIEPAGTQYKITERVDDDKAVHPVTVPPAGGPYYVLDILEDGFPGALPGSAFAQHLADLLGAHAASAISLVPVDALGDADTVQDAFERATRRRFNPESFGAIRADESTHQAAFDSCLDAAELFGGIVEVGPGPWTLEDIEARSGVSMEPLGWLPTLKLKDGHTPVNGAFLWNDGTTPGTAVSDFHIRGFNFDGNKDAAGDARGVGINGRRNVSVVECFFEDWALASAVIGSHADYATTGASNFRLERNYSKNCARSGNFWGHYAITGGDDPIMYQNIAVSTDGFAAYAFDVEPNAGDTIRRAVTTRNISINAGGIRVNAEAVGSSIIGAIVDHNPWIDASGSAGGSPAISVLGNVTGFVSVSYNGYIRTHFSNSGIDIDGVTDPHVVGNGLITGMGASQSTYPNNVAIRLHDVSGGWVADNSMDGVVSTHATIVAGIKESGTTSGVHYGHNDFGDNIRVPVDTDTDIGARIIVRGEALLSIDPRVAMDTTGVSNNDAALARAVALLRTAHNAEFKFTPGAYLLGTNTIDGLENAKFSGTSADAATIKRDPTSGNSIQLSFENCAGIEVTELGFDANGISAFGGGVNILATRGFRHHSCKYLDSNRAALNGSDRYAFVARSSAIPNQDVWFYNNHVTDLQVELDTCLRAVAARNIFVNPRYTSALVALSLTTNGVCRDYLLDDNLIVNPRTGIGAVYIGAESAGRDGSTFTNMLVRGTVIRIDDEEAAADVGRLIVVGNFSGAAAGAGQTYRHVDVLRSHLIASPDVDRPNITEGAITYFRPTGDATTFTRCAIDHNHLERVSDERAIAVRGFSDGSINHNESIDIPFGIGVGTNPETVTGVDTLYNKLVGIGAVPGTNGIQFSGTDGGGNNAYHNQISDYETNEVVHPW